MKYAVVQQNGKQYKVTEGETIEMEHLPLVKPEDVFEFSNILLVVDGDKKHVGSPIVVNAVVKATVIAHGKGEKIRVAKFKSKVRYRRVRGFRPQYTAIKINSISL